MGAPHLCVWLCLHWLSTLEFRCVLWMEAIRSRNRAHPYFTIRGAYAEPSLNLRDLCRDQTGLSSGQCCLRCISLPMCRLTYLVLLSSALALSGADLKPTHAVRFLNKAASVEELKSDIAAERSYLDAIQTPSLDRFGGLPGSADSAITMERATTLDSSASQTALGVTCSMK